MDGDRHAATTLRPASASASRGEAAQSPAGRQERSLCLKATAPPAGAADPGGRRTRETALQCHSGWCHSLTRVLGTVARDDQDKHRGDCRECIGRVSDVGRERRTRGLRPELGGLEERSQQRDDPRELCRRIRVKQPSLLADVLTGASRGAAASTVTTPACISVSTASPRYS
jgi:hypothetical protein